MPNPPGPQYDEILLPFINGYAYFNLLELVEGFGADADLGSFSIASHFGGEADAEGLVGEGGFFRAKDGEIGIFIMVQCPDHQF